MSAKHLWEVEHEYYCNLGNYYAVIDDCHQEYDSWQEFHDKEGDSDMDYNLLFRWDWKEEDEEGEPTTDAEAREHRVLALLLTAAVADTGDLE